MEEKKIAIDNQILKVITGSRLYGTNTPDSDYDYQALFVPNKEYVYGLRKCEQVFLNEDNVDYTCYSIIKFIKLAMQNNPNIISIFYTPENCICYINDYGKELINNRGLFLSKKSYHTFRGYAHQQKRKLLTKNPEGKRKKLIEKHGFDTKYATHLIRLYYECLDVLISSEIVYPSPHRKELLDIKEGKWSLDKVLSESSRLEKLVDEAYVKSDLQYSPDFNKIEELQINLLEKYWDMECCN